MAQGSFKVIIVGGSVTGLTLAHSLHRIGVDYTILEKRPEIVRQEGASIGILPNGARILDQLGLYDAVELATAPLGVTHIHFPDDFTFTSHYPEKMMEKFGYPIAFLERRRLLEILYDTLPDKTKIHVNQAVSHIEERVLGQGRSVVQVHTESGQVYEGDLVAGADGVHSRTRREMWRMSNSSGADEVQIKEAKNMSVEYSCVFGISKNVPNLKPGEQILHCGNGKTLAVIPSRDNLTFWFLTQKLDKKYPYTNAPRFTTEQAIALSLEVADAPLAEGVCFSHVWEKRDVFNMVALEENLLQTWSFGRVVCIGDSIHKMTVNLGQGANCAMEDVAMLCNMLNSRLQGGKEKKPADQEMDALLRQFNKSHISRVSHICDMSQLIVRVHARDGFLRKIMGRYFMPNFGDLFEHRPFSMLANAVALDFLPLPPRSSYSGWEKYRSKGNKISPWVIAFALLMVLKVLVFPVYKQWK